MIVEITDENALYAISPLDLSGYIKSKGAIRKGDYRDVAGVWEYKSKTILVPKDKDLADYTHIIGSAISRISDIEGRNQISIYNDLKNMGFDVIRVANESLSTSNGTLLLEKSFELIRNAQDMFLAVACSAATGKSSYTSRKPQDAESFIKSVRMGQTEHGSYVLTLLSPVVPNLSPIQLPLSSDLINEETPYELKVVPLLSKALSALPHIAEAASESGSIKPFIEHAPDGITSNLCDAIVGMHETTTDGLISISITFSKNRRYAHPICINKFDSTFIPIFKSASEYIRSSQPQSDQLVRGVITDLHRNDGADEGRITIFDTSGKRPRAVSLTLPNEQYDSLTEAHTQRWVIELEGTLEKQRNSLFIIPTSEIKILKDPIED